MGYSTKFDGQFRLTPKPPAETILRLMDLAGVTSHDIDNPAAPHSYNQWQLTRDREHLAWDGGEKFSHYVAWLQYILDAVLTPVGVTLSGTVTYSGEEARDVGTLTIVDGKVLKLAATFVTPTTLDELRSFQQFVLASAHGEELFADWQRSHKHE